MRRFANLWYDIKMIALINYHLFVKGTPVKSDGWHVSIPLNEDTEVYECPDCKTKLMVTKENFSVRGFWHDVRRLIYFWRPNQRA